MTLLGQVLIAASVLAVGVVYGTDVFSAIVLRPALALVDDRTLVSTMGRVHDFGDRRLRLPGVAGLVTAVAGTAVIAWAGHWGVDAAFGDVSAADLPEDVEEGIIESRAATFVKPVLRLAAGPDQPAACMGNPDRLRVIEEVRAKKSANGTSPIALPEADAAERRSGGGDE